MTEYSELERFKQKLGRSISESAEALRKPRGNVFYLRYLMGDKLGEVASSWELLDCECASIFIIINDVNIKGGHY